MQGGARSSVVRSARDALVEIGDGATLGIGGTIVVDSPMVLIRELLRRELRGLTVVAPTAGLGVDMLIAGGCVRRVVTAYVGAEGVAPVGPAFRTGAMRGELEVRELDEGMCVAGLRAAGQGLPFLPWRGGVGTSLPDLNPDLVEFDDPVKGERLLAVPALELDFALIHVDRGDEFGNVQIDGTGHMDLLMTRAARRVVAQVDRLVPNERIRETPGATHFWRDTEVVEAPWGAHPSATARLLPDVEAMAEYVRAAEAASGGEEEPLREYLDAVVRAPADHDAYLELVGMRRLLGLGSGQA